MTSLDRTILLVEDSEDDVFLMQRALQKAGISFPVQIASDGEQALDYLRAHGPFSDRARFPLPSLVFLDLKLPYVHGFEVLGWIREQNSLSDLPVVILTSSPEERDRDKAMALGARAYLIKPPTREMVLEAMKFMVADDLGAAAKV
jgi:CheY-like chemotaxis protein